jgi:hypothetical protein
VEVQLHALNWALDSTTSFTLRSNYNKENNYRNTQIRNFNFLTATLQTHYAVFALYN